MSDYEIYVVGGAGLFFLITGTIKLIVVRPARSRHLSLRRMPARPL